MTSTPALTPAHQGVVRDMFTRIMRTEGFIGTIDISNIRQNKTGYSATIVGQVGTHRATYRATLRGRNVRIARVGTPERIAA
jgi:hypothetical protein